MTRTRFGLSLALFTLTAAASQGPLPLKAGYDLRLVQGEDQWNVRTTSRFGSQSLLVHELGPHVVTLKVDNVTATAYTLEVAVSPAQPQKAGQAPILARSYEVAFGSTLEIKTYEGDLSVSLALVVEPDSI